ncbi:ATP-dependent RNA helicase [Corynebacterium choanae]|nr:ATP-dependent helicase C-terminal domain-containing protein [Corynebacterium choanae]
MSLPLSPFPVAAISRGLPIADAYDDIAQALSTQRGCIIQAPPGTGKTTVVPLLVANCVAEQHTSGKVVVVAPKRVAVTTAARHVTDLCCSAATEATTAYPSMVGYAVRGDSRRGTHIEFVTPGVLLQMLAADPSLTGIAAVIVDEVHERTLAIDLIVAMLSDLFQLRDDLLLVAMSATVDTSALASLLGLPVVVTTAPIHELTITYAPPPAHIIRTALSREMLAHMVDVTVQAVATYPGSVLVFLPSRAAVTTVAAMLRERVAATLPVYSLHGGMTAAEQDAALHDAQRRIVVATNIAESSITVPGVRTVVDSGLVRVPKRDHLRGMNGLVTTTAAKEEITQRAGRAGREAAGQVIRCWPARETASLPATRPPEILACDLSAAMLQAACWSNQGLAGLSLLDPPPVRAAEQAIATLRDLGAVQQSANGTLTVTPLGRRLSQLPVDPHLGCALLRYGAAAAPMVAALLLDISGELPPHSHQHSAAVAKEHSRETHRLARLAGKQQSGTPTPGAVVATAFPALVGYRVDDEQYLLASGTRARCTIVPGSQWIAAGSVRLVQGGDRRQPAGEVVVDSASPLTKEILDDLGMVTTEDRLIIDGTTIRAVREQRVGAIVLQTTPISVDEQQCAALLREQVATHGLSIFPFDDTATALRDRMQFAHDHYGSPWPDLRRGVDPAYVEQEIAAIAAGAALSGIPMREILTRLLPWPEAQQFDTLVPPTVTVASGRKIPVDYHGDRPICRVKLQECFGMTETPLIGDMPLQFHLLSPAGRPVAITDNLQRFFQGPYTEVRKELRGRYPKHPWPEHPTVADATALTKQQLQRRSTPH